MPNYEEKRLHRRITDSFLVTCHLKRPNPLVLQAGVSEVDTVAIDLSEGGLGLDSGYEIPAGAEVTVRFRLLNEHAFLEADKRREIVADGEARHCRELDAQNYRIGLLFKNLSKDDREFLSRYVQDQTRGR